MNYAEMSDAEIAEAVIKTITLDDCEYWRPSATGRGVVIVNDDNETMRTFDPCDNPADAWLLMEKKRIGLHPDAETGGWTAVRSIYKSKNVRYAKPFRAVAILFLMIEAETGK